MKICLDIVEKEGNARAFCFFNFCAKRNKHTFDFRLINRGYRVFKNFVVNLFMLCAYHFEQPLYLKILFLILLVTVFL